jgi:hypothetical protein
MFRVYFFSLFNSRNTQMRFLAAFLFVGSVQAEPLYVTVPGEGWTLKIEAPAMKLTRGLGEGRRCQYRAASIESGFTVSLSSELEGTRDNDECRQVYWSKSEGGPTKKSDIKLFRSDRASLVTHLAEAVLQGATHKTANGHAYFVKNGLCMDLHVSHWPYQSGSEQKVEEILRSMTLVD